MTSDSSSAGASKPVSDGHLRSPTGTAVPASDGHLRAPTGPSKPAGPAKSASDGHLRSLVKAATWRVTGTIDTFLLSFLFTKSVKLASSIAFTEVVTKIALFYLHERAWNRISWGRAGTVRPEPAAPYPLASETGRS
ncbi:MAG TPA: DUF2061 domain-containing protein [Microvirga sp.]|jgi:uncharacterized membrane protein|nr:DUF2061 domain-containing protein [Microvirga sp.]